MGGQGRPQGPLGGGGPVEGGGQGVQLGREGRPVLGGPAQDGVHQALVGEEAQVAGRGQLHGFVHGGMIADPGQPGQLDEPHGQRHLRAQGYAPVRIFQLGLHPGLETAPAAQTKAEHGLGQMRILTQLPVPDIGYPALLPEHFVQGVGDVEAGGRGHGAPKTEPRLSPAAAETPTPITGLKIPPHAIGLSK